MRRAFGNDVEGDYGINTSAANSLPSSNIKQIFMTLSLEINDCLLNGYEKEDST